MHNLQSVPRHYLNYYLTPFTAASFTLYQLFQDDGQQAEFYSVRLVGLPGISVKDIQSTWPDLQTLMRQIRQSSFTLMPGHAEFSPD